MAQAHISLSTTSIYIEPIHSTGDEMDQLLGFWSDGHVLHTELLRLDAPSMITPCAATAELWGPNSAPHLIHVLHDQTHALPVIDHASNMVHFTTSSHKCVSQVSATAVGHLTALIRQSRSSTRPSPLSVHQHEPAWPSPQPSTTDPVLHTCTPQVDQHGCTSIIWHSGQSTYYPRVLPINNHSSSTLTTRDKSTLCSQSPPSWVHCQHHHVSICKQKEEEEEEKLTQMTMSQIKAKQVI
jgi:hypothetical protein